MRQVKVHGKLVSYPLLRHVPQSKGWGLLVRQRCEKVVWGWSRDANIAADA